MICLDVSEIFSGDVAEAVRNGASGRCVAVVLAVVGLLPGDPFAHDCQFLLGTLEIMPGYALQVTVSRLEFALGSPYRWETEGENEREREKEKEREREREREREGDSKGFLVHMFLFYAQPVSATFSLKASLPGLAKHRQAR